MPDLKSRRRSVSSAGILMYRRAGANLEVLLVHPGGPYWRKKDEGSWSIPKGEIADGEDVEVAARREFMEETGIALSGLLDPLGEIRQRGGKRVIAFAVEGDVDVQSIQKQHFRNRVAAEGWADAEFSRDRSRRVVRPAIGPCKDTRRPATASRSARRTRETAWNEARYD